MGNYGVKIAKPGKNTSSTDLSDYNFHSTYPLLKIKSITNSFAHANNNFAESLVATIYHGLGYPPMFDVMVGFNSSTTPPTNFYPSSYYVNYPFLGDLEYMKIYSDNDNLYIYSYGPTKYVFYKAVIYYDPINP